MLSWYVPYICSSIVLLLVLLVLFVVVILNKPRPGFWIDDLPVGRVLPEKSRRNPDPADHTFVILVLWLVLVVTATALSAERYSCKTCWKIFAYFAAFNTCFSVFLASRFFCSFCCSILYGTRRFFLLSSS